MSPFGSFLTRSALLVGCLLFACSVPAAAADPIIVSVVDDETSHPIEGARVSLVGTGPGESRTEVAGPTGTVQLSGFAPGSLRVIVIAQGYADHRSSFDLPARLTSPFSVTVRLDALKRIGRTSARSRRAETERNVTPNSSVRRISSDLVDALSRLGGVAVAGDGVSARIGLRGRDPSQTTFTLNGTPVGVNAAQLAVNSDLLEEADVNSAQDTIAFTLLSPTLEPLHRIEVARGGYGSSLVLSTAQGTAGQLGFAVAHVERGADSILDRRVYRDLSGESYRHVGELVKIGDYAKLAVPIGDWSISASDAVSRSAGNPLPAYLAGALPAGTGPGERKTTTAENAVVVANGRLRGAALSFNASSWSLRAYDDARSRIVAGQPAPLIIDDATSGRSVQGYVATTIGERRTLEFLGTLTWTRTAAGYSGLAAAGATTVSAVRRTLKATERWKLDADRSVLASAVLDSDGAAVLPAVHLEDHLRRGNSDRTLSIDYARKPVRFDSSENVRGLLDPRAASYDCYGNVVTANVPGDSSARPAVIGANASLSSRSRNAHVEVSGYFEAQRGLLLTAASQRADTLPNGAFAAFVDQLVNGYGEFGGCAGSIRTSDVVLIRNVAGVSMRYDGVELAGGVNLGKRLVAEADFAVQQAVPTALPPALSSARSYYVMGRQLPNVPYWNGNVSLDWQSNDGKTEALANATLTSANNTKNLPAVSVFSVAVQRAISPKLVVTLIGTNVSASYTGDFVSPRYALPYLLANGALQPALAAPEPPPRLFLSLSYKNR